MKKVLSTLFLVAFVVCNCFAVRINIKDHNGILDALTNVKNSATTVRMEANGSKWPVDVQKNMALLYFKATEASQNLADRYVLMIKNYKKEIKNGTNLNTQLTALEKANNDMVTYFEANYKLYGSGSSAGITTEVIELVFSGLTKGYEFIKKLKSDGEKKYIAQIDDQRITKRFNGKPLNDDASDKEAGKVSGDTTKPAKDKAGKTDSTNKRAVGESKSKGGR
jgi:hypothetical protein